MCINLKRNCLFFAKTEYLYVSRVILKFRFSTFPVFQFYKSFAENIGEDFKA
jgi:hypothetical protein